MKKTIAIALILALTILCVPMSVFADTGATNGDADVLSMTDGASGNAYYAYIGDEKPVTSVSDITVQGSAGVGSGVTVLPSYTDDNKDVHNNVVKFAPASSSTYTVNVDKAGLYYLGITYLVPKSSTKDVSYSLQINGAYPFADTKTLSLPCYWTNDGDVRSDDSGNQIAPLQKQLNAFTTRFVFDNSGVVTNPYLFRFNSGANTIEIAVNDGEMIVKSILVSSHNSESFYADVSKAYEKKGYSAAKGDGLIIEAEDAFSRSARALVPKATFDIDLSPSDSRHQVINYIGSTNWKKPNEEITWKFHIDNAGLYNFGFIYKQDQILNGYAYRSLKIDGQIPFTEAENLRFSHCNNWSLFKFSDENEKPYLIYLSEGDHELTLSATLGELTDVYSRLQAVCADLRELYMEIIMITGESPDANRDYNLYKQIDGFQEKLDAYHAELSSIIDLMRDIYGVKTNSQISVLVNTDRVLKNMIKKLYEAETYLSDYYTQYTSLSSSLTTMSEMPLSLDRIFIAPAEDEIVFEKKNIFQRFGYSFIRFVSSFSSEYDTLTAATGEGKTIKLWVNWGRDQAMALNSLIQTTFTPETGINVKLELTAASIINGMLAHNAPDVVLQQARTEPVNLAMRSALYNLKEFDDYEEVVKRFASTATVPYEYKDGVYALPDSQSFYLMFYRSDILKELGLSVPQTWEDFLAVGTVLQMNNMNSWIPYTQIADASTVVTGVGGLNLFASILQQRGGTFYNPERTVCKLDDPVTLSAFSFWTDLYIKYKFPISVSFYNRFRVGITPLGIEAYGNYNQLSQTAPEIKGRWGVALVPGTKQEDGTIDHTVSGSGSGCVILHTSKDPDSAWEFLKWWTSAETQLLYNNEIESILGPISRISTSNVEAFNNMSWDRKDLEILNKQRSLIKEIPEVPGSYYVSRAVDQAFWAVNNTGENVKDALLRWADFANEEIERKIKEYDS